MAPGGVIIADSTLIGRKVRRTDVTAYYVPATQMASDAGIPTLANMIIAGKLLKILNADAPDSVAAALEKVISAKHRDMLDVNRKALEMGAEAK